MSRVGQHYRDTCRGGPAREPIRRKSLWSNGWTALRRGLRRLQPRQAAQTRFERLIGVRPAEAPRGLYIFGAVGRGKTLLMDLFFEAAPVKAKRRVHFHAFMADVHARIHQWRQRRKRGEVAGEDPIAPVAADMAAQAWLLCFDEFSVRDIADAMILGAAVRAACSPPASSSSRPRTSRPTISTRTASTARCSCPSSRCCTNGWRSVALEARTDFRLEKLARAPVYYTPAGRRGEGGARRGVQAPDRP